MAAAARAAHVEVDCRRWDGILRRIWTSFGCDELNWTATPRGKQNLATLHAFMETPYTLRAHNLYTSGTGRGLPHWSSSNVYHEDATGRPLYDWTLVDPVFDAWVHHGCRPIVECYLAGFLALSSWTSGGPHRCCCSYALCLLL